jgi:hypothetical protein
MSDRPIPKPKQFLKVLDILNTQDAANMIDPKSYADMVGQYAFKAYKNDELSYRDYLGIVKPLFGKAGEMVTKKIEERDKDLERYATGGRVKYSDGSDEPDISKLKEKIIELMDTDNLTFEEAYREAREEGYAVGGRVGFDEGTPKKKGGNYNPEGKNQFTGKQKPVSLIASIIDKYSNFRAKDFRGEGKLNNPKMGDDFKGKLLTKDDLLRAKAEGIEPKVKGKIKFKDTRGDQNLKASQFYKSTQGSSISMDKINNFAHYAPKLLSYLTSTADTGPLKAEVNRAAEGYDKKALSIAEKQEKLIKEKPKGYKYKLAQLNFLAANESKKANKTLPSALKGTLGFFTVNPDTGKFTLKGVDRAKTFAGISGEKQEFKKMDPSIRAAFGPTQSKVQGIIDLIKSKIKGADIKRASNAPTPTKTLTANMFKGAFKGLPGKSGEIKDPLGGPDLIDIKKLDKNPYNDI